MKYRELKPTIALEPYIHSFWELKGDETDSQWERNFPDGCPGLVINLGNECITDNGVLRMDFGKTYAVGTMTSFKDSFIEEGTHLFGVCLKPASFSNFYSFAALNELTGKTVQFEKSNSFSIEKLIRNPADYLNSFFVNRLQTTHNGLLQSVIADIHRSNGQLSIDHLAKRNFVTVRWLERNFKTYIGITPKAYSNIVRFQNAFALIKSSSNEQSLLDIAFECGFYDHSHLANEIKRNTGVFPSQL
ncbi:AraC family transcriptional regulator [Chryseobacterium lactis]|uniref:L-rhamnose operon regulatory protein rhaS n=2 Tax=Bacteroidota TaxID=976 RepID=A0A4U9VKR6_9SPHI|nr:MULTISPECIES: helix-turn-helix transcriptional regulator [Bacteroidota]OJV55622.1 MAG: AraC family transcriptional regulator [Bacteroidetes bacterium 43-16]AZA84054.1 AraC family transcriptional regulator [Chryseobacterium lactis]AZB04440.1 AraC family transcriptional regulator [Chryseobacterium lactis]MCT3745543.1 helix-turn-helix transcriptional regulator [Elizabethkingia anophelis]MDC8027104.1 helix-turn-helix transcriptional regulator [Elizabethkingia anophelis]